MCTKMIYFMWLNSQKMMVVHLKVCWRYDLHLWPRVRLCSIYEDFVFSGLQQGCPLGFLHLMDSLPMAKEPRALEFALRFFSVAARLPLNLLHCDLLSVTRIILNILV